MVNESESDDNQEDEDSNDENNWRNEYPDEDDDNDGSIGERQIRNAVENFDLENDLSSEEESGANRNGFVNSVDTQAIGFEDDLDYSNSKGHGESYAKYRKRIEKEMNEESDSNSDDGSDNSDNDDYYSD